MIKQMLFFLKVGAISFGKMVATNYMYEEYVDKKKTLTKDEFFAINGMCKLLPGPSQTQMSIILGILERGKLFGIVTGLMYLLPSFLLITLSAYFYFEKGSVIDTNKLNYGLVPFSLALMLDASLKLGKKSIDSWATIVIFIIASVLAFFSVDMIIILLISGLLGIILHIDCKKLLKKDSQDKLFTVSPIIFFSEPLVSLFLFFLKLGAIVYGGGLVLIPMIHDKIVVQSQWLTEEEFLFGFVIGSTTPGPVILTVAFIAYKVAMTLGYQGIVGSVLAGVGVMLPSFIIIIALSKIILKSKNIVWLSNMVKGIMPATLGSVLIVSLHLAKNSISDYFQVILVLLFFGMGYFLKLNPLIILLISGSLGFFVL